MNSISLIRPRCPALEANGHQLVVWDATQMPTNSHYVPTFIDLVQHFEEAGRISPDRTILVETSTGNAGAAAAYVARELGYAIHIFMPEDMPTARIADVESYLPEGSQVVRTPRSKYVAGMQRTFRQFLVAHRDGYGGKELFPLDHSRAPVAIESFCAIARRILDQIGGPIHHAIFALGNGTTTTGFGRVLKAAFPSVNIIGVEPLEAPCVFVRKYGAEEFQRRYHCRLHYRPHELIGTGAWDVSFPNYDLELIDDVKVISEREWRHAGPELSRLTGENFGHTSAACYATVTERSCLIGRDGKEHTFFTIFYDSGRKY